MKKRREALCAIVAFPMALLQHARSIAQPGGRRTLVGLLDASDRSEWWDALRQQLREFGYVEGRNVVFETRLAKGELDLLPGMARELVRLKANVIVTSGTSAALAARRATTTIPIVMATGTDQVSLGLAVSLARPGRNVTGLSTLTSELMGKRFELVHELLPNIGRLAVLWHNENLSSMASVREPRSSRIKVEGCASDCWCRRRRRPGRGVLIDDARAGGSSHCRSSPPHVYGAW